MINFMASTKVYFFTAIAAACGLTLLGCAHQQVNVKNLSDVESLIYALKCGNPSVRLAGC
jgi:hypothetical protein